MPRLPLPGSRGGTSAAQRRYAVQQSHVEAASSQQRQKPCVREQLMLTALCRAAKPGESRKQSAAAEAVRARAAYANG
eukprot:5179937-Heterocapsa_arctica.AAC.1